MDWSALFTTQNAIALVTLTALEIVLGIDNIIVIAVVTARLPKEQQAKARQLGLLLAMGMRVLLLLAIAWIMKLDATLFAIDLPFFSHEFSGKDLILVGGGLFLIFKATKEIHAKVEGPTHAQKAPRAATFTNALVQILLLDLVFSLDSVITAVGMAQSIIVMIIAVVASIGVMMLAAGRISAFVERHPTVKILALAFLILIGVLLTAEGIGQHVGRGYIYFAMAFSLIVEIINMRIRAKHTPPAAAG